MHCCVSIVNHKLTFVISTINDIFMVFITLCKRFKNEISKNVDSVGKQMEKKQRVNKETVSKVLLYWSCCTIYVQYQAYWSNDGFTGPLRRR
jgi:hypothetical protein